MRSTRLRRGLRACEVNPRGIAVLSVVDRRGFPPIGTGGPSAVHNGARVPRRPPYPPASLPGPGCGGTLGGMTPLDRRPTRLAGLLLAAVMGTLAALSGPAGATGAPRAPDPVGQWPLVPRPPVLAAFDPPSDPWGPGHRGVDLLGAVGQPVRAALAGRITFAGRIAGRGVVVVDHGPTRTTYEPVVTAVARGDEVAAGQPDRHPRPRRLALLPPRVPALGLVARARRTSTRWVWSARGPVRLLPLWRADPVPRPAAAPRLPYADWRPWLLAAPALRPGGGPAGRPAGAGPW